jgi:predicted  nucleic acid-binding Zn-ribbon protein
VTGVPRQGIFPCPICVVWTCSGCGHVKRSGSVDGRVPQKCSKCGCRKGTTVPVTHLSRDTYDAHVSTHWLEDSVHGVDLEQMIVDAALVEYLRPLIQRYERYRRLALAIARDSREWNRCVNLGHEELKKIESTVRSWVHDHPEKP